MTTTAITATVTHVRGWWDAPSGLGRRWCADLDAIHRGSGDPWQLQLLADPGLQEGDRIEVEFLLNHSVIYDAQITRLPQEDRDA